MASRGRTRQRGQERKLESPTHCFDLKGHPIRGAVPRLAVFPEASTWAATAVHWLTFQRTKGMCTALLCSVITFSPLGHCGTASCIPGMPGLATAFTPSMWEER